MINRRWNDLQKSLVGIAQLKMSDDIRYFNVTQAFTITIPTVKYFKLILYATGYEDYIIPNANINIEFQNYVKFSQNSFEGMQLGIPRGKIN